MPERILITVKTYPCISKKYLETVCTAGVNQEGQWIRLYPVQFRYLDPDKQYRLYDIIETEFDPHGSHDGRPESRRPKLETIRVVDHLKEWSSRHQWIGKTIFSSLDELMNAGRSIGPVRVGEVIDLIARKVDDEWSAKQKEQLKQDGLFEKRKPLEKIPWEFRFIWKDADGIEHDNMFISWEVCETFRKYRLHYENPIERIREVWLEQKMNLSSDRAFFVGNHSVHRQNFMICDCYYPPKEVTDAQTLW